MPERKGSKDLRELPDPGPPPPGVRLETSGAETRIVFGRVGGSGLLATFLAGLGRLFLVNDSSYDGAICFDLERIWVERPVAGAQWMANTRAAFEGAFAPETRTESLPLDSMPLSAVERVRVEANAANRQARLLVEARAGRLELVGGSADATKLEWARDYLRGRLLRGATSP